MQITNMPLMGEGETLGDQIQKILPILLQATDGSETEQNSRLSVLNLLLTMQDTMSTQSANGQQTDIMSIILPALAEQFKGQMSTAQPSNGGRRLEAEHVDFNQLDQILQSGDFSSILNNMMDHPTMQEEVVAEEAPVQGRYRDVIIAHNIDIPEDMEDDLTAILNYGGLSAEQSELVALLIIHAPIEENQHLVDHLGLADKPEVMQEIGVGYGRGTMALKLFGLDGSDGRQLQQNQQQSAGYSSLQGTQGPST